MKPLPSKRQFSNGFALIATILLMVLLAIITIGTLSLSVVNLRTGTQDSAQARARANARVALMIAIGELQKQMGADQRISAKSDIVNPESSEIIHRHWIGTWNSWKAGDSESSQHSTIQGVADNMAPTYLPNRNDYFRKWLVSLTNGEASSISTPRDLSLQGANFPSITNNAIFFVAQGSLGKVKNTAMTVTTDVGDAEDIHPRKKEPVGLRLALAARALAYGEKIEYSGPLYESMKAESGKITLQFQHIGGGLMAKDGALKGFTIAGKDKTFVPAKAEIQGDTIVVSAEGILDPIAVRYGWANVPDVNLYNQEGLPASPFRTDVE
jgi:hypothetical protein